MEQGREAVHKHNLSPGLSLEACKGRGHGGGLVRPTILWKSCCGQVTRTRENQQVDFRELLGHLQPRATEYMGGFKCLKIC